MVLGVLVLLLLAVGEMLRTDSVILGVIDSARPSHPETKAQRLIRVFLPDRANR